MVPVGSRYRSEYIESTLIAENVKKNIGTVQSLEVTKTGPGGVSVADKSYQEIWEVLLLIRKIRSAEHWGEADMR